MYLSCRLVLPDENIVVAVAAAAWCSRCHSSCVHLLRWQDPAVGGFWSPFRLVGFSTCCTRRNLGVCHKTSVFKLNIATLLDLEHGQNQAWCGHPLPWSYWRAPVKGLTPKQVHQDTEATLQEGTTSYSMVKKWVGQFKSGRESGRESLVDDPRPGRLYNAQWCPILSIFPFSRSRRLETAYWLCLIICKRKIRNGYSFKFTVYSSIE